MKILQIVESLNNGAVENWLVNCFIQIRRLKPDWEWTFFCILNEPGKLEKVVLSGGGRVVKSKNGISRKREFITELSHIVNMNSFDIIHAHHDYLNAFYFLAIHRSRAFKISQIHNTDKHLPIKSRCMNKLAIPILKLMNNLCYDKLIGISRDTIREFKFGLDTECAKNILYYGINFQKLNIKQKREEFIQEFNLPSNALILLFVGRFTVLKNPSFLIEILNDLINQSSLPFYALFVGEGYEKEKIVTKAVKFNLSDKIRFSGWSHTTEKFFFLSDVFVFPRVIYPKEGFGMVMLEAQAAGIQTVVSTGVSNETIVIDEIVHFLDDVEDSVIWANKILDVYKMGHVPHAIDVLEKSQFNMELAARRVTDLYENHKFVNNC